MDQYWICEKKILLFVSYFIGILKLMSGNNSSHPDYRTSEMFLSLYFLVSADWLCFQTFALLRVGGKAFCLPSPPQLSLLPQLAEQSGWEQQHIPRLSDLSVSAILQGLLRTVTPVLCLCSGETSVTTPADLKLYVLISIKRVQEQSTFLATVLADEPWMKVRGPVILK